MPPIHPNPEYNRALYEDYGIFLGYFDDAHSFRSRRTAAAGPNAALSVRDRFKYACAQHAKHRESPAAAVSIDEARLFEPVFATAFGHYDDIALTLVDDFADFAQMTSWSPELESYTLGLCPRLAAFSPGGVPPHFVSARTLMSEGIRSQCPLLSITHLKIAGQGTLRYGLNAQAAAIETIIDRVERLLTLGTAATQAEGLPQVFSSTDFTDVRCCLVEPLSSDDITLIAIAKNYSVIGCIIAALRSLRFQDLRTEQEGNEHSADTWVPSTWLRCCLKDADGADPVESRSSPPLSDINQLLGDNATTDKSFIAAIADTPLFVSSYTTLGAFSKASELAELASRVTGKVGIYGVADISPGYDSVVARRLISSGRNFLPGRLDFGPGDAHFQTGHWRLVHPGHHDIAYTLSKAGFEFQDRLIDTAALLTSFSKLFTRDLVSADAISPLFEAIDLGVLDLSTHLAIPIYRYENDDGIPSDFTADQVAFRRLLELPIEHVTPFPLVERLYGIQADVRQALGLDDASQFERYLHDLLGLPPSARAVTLRAFNDFVTALADPLLFDDVVDLTDAFFGLHRYIFIGAPTLAYGADETTSFVTRSQLRRFAVEYIGDISSALQSRIGRATPRHDGYFARDDVRGSLGDLFASADTVLKCSMGAYRAAQFGDNDPHGAANKRKAAAVVSAQLNQRSRAHISSIPPAESYLLSMTSDIGNLFRIESLIGIVHEIGHFFFNTHACKSLSALEYHLLSRSPEDQSQLLAGATDVYDAAIKDVTAASYDSEALVQLYEHASEHAADACVRLMVFGDDENAFVAHAVRSFTTLQAELTEDFQWRGDAIVWSHIALMGRLHRICAWYDNWRNLSKPSLDIMAFTAKWRYMSPVLGVLSDAEFELLSGAFKAACGDHGPELQRIIWMPLLRLFNEVYGDPSRAEQCVLDVHAAHEQGIPYPLIASQYATRWNESEIVFAILRDCASRAVAIAEKQDCRPQNGRPHFDVTDGAVRGLLPEERAAQFRWHACSYKALWHFSARQRCRRLIELLQSSTSQETAETLPTC